ncbi:ALP1-like protein, partial [Tanacetum coccineum]
MPKYLIKPTSEDVVKIQQKHNNVHGFPGMLGSIDCMHWEWKNCPVSWQGQYGRGDKKYPTIMLEVVASQDLWIWHAFYGMAGANNDINVLDNSPLFDDLLDDLAPVVPYVVNGVEYRNGYYLADGIYPEWASFVKSFTVATDPKHTYFKQRQESARKDVERAFGVLQGRWGLIQQPARAYEVNTLRRIMYAGIIMHNMILEDQNMSVVDMKHVYSNPARLIENRSHEGDDHCVTHLTTFSSYSIKNDFLNKLPKVCINDIRNIGKAMSCVDVATVKKIERESDWYKIPLRVMDSTGSVSLTLFDRQAYPIIDKSAAEFLQEVRKKGDMDILPTDFNKLLEKTYAFKVYITDFNLEKDKHTYGISQLTNDTDIITELIKRESDDQEIQSSSQSTALELMSQLASSFMSPPSGSKQAMYHLIIEEAIHRDLFIEQNLTVSGTIGNTNGVSTLHMDSFCSITAGTDLAALLIKTSLIIWDEASMMHKHCFEALDRSLGDIIRQILPVILGGTRQDVVYASLNSSYIWDDCTIVELTTNIRLREGSDKSNIKEIKEFRDWILKMGDGRLGGPNNGEATVDILDDILISDNVDPIASLIEFVYLSLLDNLQDTTFFQERAILAPTHEVVGVINDCLLSQIPGEEVVYYSSDSICESKGVDNTYTESLYSPEVLNGLKLFGIPNHILALKVGASVMLLQNIDQTVGLCNGTKLRILKLGEHVIEAQIMTGTNVDHTTIIPRLKLSPSDKRLPLKINRRQFPL